MFVDELLDKPGPQSPEDNRYPARWSRGNNRGKSEGVRANLHSRIQRFAFAELALRGLDQGHEGASADRRGDVAPADLDDDRVRDRRGDRALLETLKGLFLEFPLHRLYGDADTGHKAEGFCACRRVVFPGRLCGRFGGSSATPTSGTRCPSPDQPPPRRSKKTTSAARAAFRIFSQTSFPNRALILALIISTIC